MKKLGIDIGTSTVKLVLMEEGRIEKKLIRKHLGRILPVLKELLEELGETELLAAAVTGSNAKALLSASPEIPVLDDIPAIVEGSRFLCPGAGSIIEIGSQGARFITDLREGEVPEFAVNEHCAGGTGSFFEDQMSRLGLKIEDYSELVRKSRSVPRLSGRCAVFAKTDIIHRQQEGVSTPDILMGLCYAMVRNYKATIVKSLAVRKPVVFCGGVTLNAGMEQAIREVFRLQDKELVTPEEACFASAAGAACKAQGRQYPLGNWDEEKCASDSGYKEQTLFRLGEIIRDINSLLERTREKENSGLPVLVLKQGTCLKEPEVTGVIPESGCALGIDIGSTSTDLVIVDMDGKIVDFQYLRTAGNPEKAVRDGLTDIRYRFGEIRFRAVGITGSGRERLGRMMGADAIRDEITAQAKAAAHWVPQADTVFEIGGQDSKYISLKDGQVCDFQMNKICAAGTGSFVEEQASRMGIPIEKFGPAALTSKNPSELGERCTVFIETAIASAEAQGAGQEDIAAGLCHSIVRNYLHKVVGTKHVGQHIVLQGGVAYNPGIVAAFQSAYGDRLEVSPVFSISGAYGAALLACEELEANGNRQSTFLGFDFPSQERKINLSSEEIRRNKAFYKKAGQFAIEGYDPVIDPDKKTVGVPLVLIMFKFFPLVNEFFKDLGYNVILSHASNEETIQLSQQYAQGETCYPIKLVYGHMMQLAKQKVDYIFLPNIHTIRHPHAHAAHNFACPYMQTAGKSIYDSLGLKEQGIELISPVFDLDLGVKSMAKAMIGVGISLGFSAPKCAKAMLKGGMAVQRYTENVEKLGQEMLASVKPEDKVLVLITRNYGISDPVLNMGLPEILLSRGYKVMTLGHLPGMSLDVSGDYPNMYWPFGDHLMSGAKLIASHPNLYAVYLTNHGCGPDTLINHMFREEMGDKPYLQIEVDEHFSAVGVITRVEAFLNSICRRPPVALPENFDIRNVHMKPANITYKPDKAKELEIPDLGIYSWYLKRYFERCGYQAGCMSAFSKKQLLNGRARTNSKEYLPFSMLLGECLDEFEKNDKERIQFLIPFNEGADADGQYARAVRTVLDREGFGGTGIVAPMLEKLPVQADDPELLFRALVAGDIIYSAPGSMRELLYTEEIPSWEELKAMAGKISLQSTTGRKLAVVGTPMSMISLNEGVLDTLESEGEILFRAPLSEMLWFLWKDCPGNEKAKQLLQELRKRMLEIGEALGSRSSFAREPLELFTIADQFLSDYSGANGRYRYAKIVDMGRKCSGILAMAPRYENTSMVLTMRGVHKNCQAPVYDLSLDGDWDTGAWSRLRSFLYYLAE